MGSWGLPRDIMEDQLWTDPASRFPAPPCLLPRSRSFLRNRSEPGGTDGAQGSLRAQIKQGLEESSQRGPEDRGTQPELEGSAPLASCPQSAYTKGDAPENSTQQRLLLIINARGKQGQNSKGLLWGTSMGVLVTRALRSLGFQDLCHPLSILGLGAEGEMHLGVSWDPAS